MSTRDRRLPPPLLALTPGDLRADDPAGRERLLEMSAEIVSVPGSSSSSTATAPDGSASSALVKVGPGKPSTVSVVAQPS